MKSAKYFPFYLISIIPMFLLYVLSDIAFLVLYYLVKYRRDVVLLNLRNSFPEKSEDELKKISIKFYKHFSDIAVEAIKSLTIGKKQIKKRLHVVNPELLQKFYDQKRSVIMYTAHFGTWEWLGFLPLTISHQLTSFYQPLSNTYLDGFMKFVRSRHGAICVESKKGYRAVIQFARENISTLNLIIGDQSPTPNSAMHWTRFLNQDTAFLLGAEAIAVKSNQVVIFPLVKELKRGYYEVEFILIEEFPTKINGHEIIDKYASLLEDSIKQAPELWLWSHKRWKLKKTDAKP